MPIRFKVRRAGIGGGRTRRGLSAIARAPRWVSSRSRGPWAAARRRDAAAAASGVMSVLALGAGRNTSRSGRRKSIAASGRSSTAWSCCNCISRSSATTSWPSGSMTSMPLAIAQVPPAFADPNAGQHFFRQRGTFLQRIEKSRRRDRCASADDQRQMAELRNVLIGDDLAGTIDQQKFPLESARSRTAVAPAAKP